MTSLIAALTMIMTPGGHGTLSPHGLLCAESGTTRAGSAAMCYRSPYRGVFIRVWEDGSTRVKVYRDGRVRLTVTACIQGKGCED